jgi:hypothetical protein
MPASSDSGARVAPRRRFVGSWQWRVPGADEGLRFGGRGARLLDRDGSGVPHHLGWDGVSPGASSAGPRWPADGVPAHTGSPAARSWVAPAERRDRASRSSEPQCIRSSRGEVFPGRRSRPVPASRISGRSSTRASSISHRLIRASRRCGESRRGWPEQRRPGRQLRGQGPYARVLVVSSVTRAAGPPRTVRRYGAFERTRLTEGFARGRGRLRARRGRAPATRGRFGFPGLLRARQEAGGASRIEPEHSRFVKHGEDSSGDLSRAALRDDDAREATGRTTAVGRRWRAARELVDLGE